MNGRITGGGMDVRRAHGRPYPGKDERTGGGFRPLAAALLLLALAASPAGAAGFTELEPGIEWGEFAGPADPSAGDTTIRVARIDPARFRLRLLLAGEGLDGTTRSVAGWGRDHKLAAAVNASMFQEDGRTSVSLLRRRGKVNNAHLSRDNSVLLFDPLEPALPPVRIVDRLCEKDFDALAARYAGAVQSIRMISCKGENTWAPQPQRWPASLIGVDGAGRVLFIYCGGYLRMHDLVNGLLALPLDLKGLQYAEGGDPAQLYVEAGGVQRAMGGGAAGRPVPNVLGFERIK
jgi:hypothetical protein